MDRCFAAGLDLRIVPAPFAAPLGFEPFDPECVEGSQWQEFLTRLTFINSILPPIQLDGDLFVKPF